MYKNNTSATIPELTAILLARLGFLWLIVLISLLFPSDDASFYAFMGVAFIITIPYSLWLRNRLRATQFAPLQFVVDIILVKINICLGGIQSDLNVGVAVTESGQSRYQPANGKGGIELQGKNAR